MSEAESAKSRLDKLKDALKMVKPKDITTEVTKKVVGLLEFVSKRLDPDESIRKDMSEKMKETKSKVTDKVKSMEDSLKKGFGKLQDVRFKTSKETSEEVDADDMNKTREYTTSGVEPPKQNLFGRDLNGLVNPNTPPSNTESTIKPKATKNSGSFSDRLEEFSDMIAEKQAAAVKEVFLGKEGLKAKVSKGKGIIDVLKESITGRGEDGEKMSLWERALQGRKDARNKEVEDEKASVRERSKKNGKKSFWGKIFGVGGILLTGIASIVGGLAKTLLTTGMFTLGKILVTSLFKSTRFLIGSLLKGMNFLFKGLGKTILFAAELIMSKGLMPLGRKIASGFGKLGGVLSKTGWGSKLVGGVKAIGKSKWFGWAAKGAKWLGRGARWLGKGLLLASGPIGWAITIGLLAWDAYDLYKALSSDGDFPDTLSGKITRLRLMGYGINKDNTAHFKDILQLEEATGPWFKYNPSTQQINFNKPSQEGLENIHKALGINGEDPESDAMKYQWFNERFIPVYGAFLKSLWQIKDSLSPGKIDSLDRGSLARLVVNFECPKEVFEKRNLPFPDQPVSSVTIREFDDLMGNLRNEVKEDYDKVRRQDIVDINKMDAESKANLRKRMSEIEKKHNLSKDSTGFNKYFAKNGIDGDNPEAGDTSGPFGGVKKSNMYQNGDDGANYNERISRNGVDFSGNGNVVHKNVSGHASQNLALIKPIPAGTVFTSEMAAKGGTGGNVNSMEDGNNMPLGQVFDTASRMSGVPVDILYDYAKKESSLDPKSFNPSTRASGLMNFLPSTWGDVLTRFGANYGIPSDASPFNPLYNVLMGAEYIKSNMSRITGYNEVGLTVPEALYLCHFFGPSGGQRVIKALLAGLDNDSIKNHMGTQQYEKNPQLKNLTVRQAVDKLLEDLRAKSKIPAEDFVGFKNHKKAKPELYKGAGKVTNDIGTSPKLPEKSATTMFNYDGSDLSAGLTGRASVHQSDLTKQIGETFSKYGMGDKVEEFYNEQDVVQKNESAIKTFTSGSYDDGTNYQPMRAHDIGGTNPTSYGENESLEGGDAGENAGSIAVHPIPPGYRYAPTSPVGKRGKVKGVSDASTNHKGVDFAPEGGRAGMPIVATGNGVVMYARSMTGFGNVVFVKHSDGLITKYAHLSGYNVKEGQNVRAGQVVGYMGNTGWKGMKVHLHFEIRGGPGKTDKVYDPMDYPIFKKSFKGWGVFTINEKGGGSTEVPEEDTNVMPPPPGKDDPINAPASEGPPTESQGVQPMGGNAMNNSYGETGEQGISDDSISGTEKTEEAREEDKANRERVMKARKDEILQESIDKYGEENVTFDGNTVNVNSDMQRLETTMNESVGVLKIIAEHLSSMDKGLASKISEGINKNITVDVNQPTGDQVANNDIKPNAGKEIAENAPRPQQRSYSGNGRREPSNTSVSLRSTNYAV